MKPEIKAKLSEFVKSNASLVKAHNFSKLYVSANYMKDPDEFVPALTELLYEAGYEPLDYLTIVPKRFNCNNANIQSLNLPRNITSIDMFAYDSCQLKELIIGPNIKVIDQMAFQQCFSLEDVQISEGLEKLGSGVFFGCMSLKDIVLPNTLLRMGDYCFSDCGSLQFVDIVGDIGIIPTACFKNCFSLEEISFCASVKIIQDRVFENCHALNRIFFLGSRSQFTTIDIDKDVWKWITERNVTIKCSDGIFEY